MIHFRSGKPRAGKSYSTCEIGLNRLLLPVYEERLGQQVPCRPIIVGNFEWVLDGVQEYLDRKGANCHALEWIEPLTKDQAKQFYLYRGRGVVLPTDAEGNPVFDSLNPYQDPPVLYILDEVHLLFNSREWAKTGKPVLHYASQHAKLGDNMILVTQFVGNVDKQFRVLAQDFTYVDNEKLSKVGGFRKGNKFIARTYDMIPTRLDKAASTQAIKFDRAIAACYDTTAGIGVPGGGLGDKGKDVKGMSIGAVIWAVAGVLVALLSVGLVAVLRVARNAHDKHGAGALPAIQGKTDPSKKGLEIPHLISGATAKPPDSFVGVSPGARWLMFGPEGLLMDNGQVVPVRDVVAVGDTVAIYVVDGVRHSAVRANMEGEK